jgi:hypothetical protein
MSKRPFAKGVKETRSAGLRYILPDDREVALSDLNIQHILDMIHTILDLPDRPLFSLPSTTDMLNLLSEVFALVLSNLSEEHYAEPQLNPEISSTGQISPSIEDKSGARGNMPVTDFGSGSRYLGLTPRDQADEVTIVSNPNAGRPESRTMKPFRHKQGRYEPLPLTRLIKWLSTSVATLPSNGLGEGWKHLSLAMDKLEGKVPMSEGTPRSGVSSHQTAIPSIAALAAAYRRLKRQKVRKGR